MSQSIAYTSSSGMTFTPPTPPAGLTDVIIDLSSLSLPVATVDVYAAGLDPTDNAATFTYLWSVVSQPIGGTQGAFTSTTSAHTTFGPISSWGNYRLMCVVTSSGAGGASEANILKAPATAFLTIRVKEAKYGLQKPAKFEREWQTPVREYADKILAVKAQLDGTRIQDLSGVSGANATSVNLNKLFDGTNVAGYHAHGAGDLPLASGTAKGIASLSRAPADALNPVALNSDQVVFSAFVDGTPTVAGYTPGQVSVPAPRAGTTGLRPCCLFKVPEDMTLLYAAAQLGDGGHNTVGYQFKLYKGSVSDWMTGTPTEITSATAGLNGGTTNSGEPLLLSASGLSDALSGGSLVGLVCTTAPSPAGGQMTVQILAERRV